MSKNKYLRQYGEKDSFKKIKKILLKILVIVVVFFFLFFSIRSITYHYILKYDEKRVTEVGLYIDDSLLGKNRGNTIKHDDLTLQDKIYTLMTDYYNSKDIINNYNNYSIGNTTVFSFPGNIDYSTIRGDDYDKYNSYYEINYGSRSIYGSNFKSGLACDCMNIDNNLYIENNYVYAYENGEKKINSNITKKLNYDFDQMFDEYVQEVYGCTYQKDC